MRPFSLRDRSWVQWENLCVQACGGWCLNYGCCAREGPVMGAPVRLCGGWCLNYGSCVHVLGVCLILARLPRHSKAAGRRVAPLSTHLLNCCSS